MSCPAPGWREEMLSAGRTRALPGRGGWLRHVLGLSQLSCRPSPPWQHCSANAALAARPSSPLSTEEPRTGPSLTPALLFLAAVQFTGDWETGWVTANTSYKSFSQALVNVDIGLHVGLAGVNVTLMGNPVNQVNETINYNEHFDWSFSADYDHSYGEGLEKGLPNPILYVAEKFTTQSPCNLHRQYRISGHYASATLWVAFCTWLISNMLFSMPVLVYGGYMLLITGAFMIFSLISFSTVRNSPMCPIHFGTAVLHIGYGGSFWLTLVIGLLCLVAGIAVVALHYFNLDLLKTFFDLREDKAEEYQEMTQVYVNSHCGNKGLCPSQPSKLNSI